MLFCVHNLILFQVKLLKDFFDGSKKKKLFFEMKLFFFFQKKIF